MEKHGETITFLGKEVPRANIQKVLNAAAKRKAEFDPNIEVFKLFGLLDFSNTELKFRKKTKMFFNILEETKKVEIQAEGHQIGMFIIRKESLLKVESKNKKREKRELRIPVPVFLRIIDKKTFILKKEYELGTFLDRTLEKYGIEFTKTVREKMKDAKWEIRGL